MEVIDIVMQIISQVGFPIAMCLVLVWYINNTMKQMGITLESLKKTVENNTDVVTKLNERLSALEDVRNDEKKQ